MKILILLLYYERPILVRNALASVLRAGRHHDDWQVAFLDDSSPTPGRPIVEEVLAGHLDKVTFYNTEMSVEEKKATGGMIGKSMNQAISDSDADVAVMLCDDDELYGAYLRNLRIFLEARPATMSCYSNVHLYVPGIEKSEYVNNLVGSYNKYRGPICAANKVDAAQVAWRTEANKKKGVWFDENRTKFLDSHFYKALYNNTGPCIYTGFVAQYKGMHAGRLIAFENEEVWAGQDIDGSNHMQNLSLKQARGLVMRYVARGHYGEAIRIADIGLKRFPDDVHITNLKNKALAATKED